MLALQSGHAALMTRAMLVILMYFTRSTRAFNTVSRRGDEDVMPNLGFHVMKKYFLTIIDASWCHG